MIKESSSGKHTLKERVRGIVRLVLFLLVLMRIYILFTMSDYSSFQSVYYFSRQLIYTVAWISLFWFFVNFTFKRSYKIDKIYTTRMKTSALFAMVACFVKFCVTLVFQYPYVYSSYLTMSYGIVELVAWLVLSLFFLVFWYRKRQEEGEVGPQL